MEDVSDDHSDVDNDMLPIMTAAGTITSILGITTCNYLSCVVCGRSIRHSTDVSGNCTHCRATMKLSHCKSSKSAKALLNGNSKN